MDPPLDSLLVGGPGDGGYYLPEKQIAHCSKVCSPGVGEVINFEIDLMKKGLIAYCADGNISSLPSIPEELKSGLYFTNKNIGLLDDDNTIFFHKWINESIKENEKYILQMDVEGFEHVVLPKFIESNLQLPQILVLEIHGAHFLFRQDYIGALHRHVLDVIFEKYEVYYHQINSLAGFVRTKHINLPKAIEITFILRS